MARIQLQHALRRQSTRRCLTMRDIDQVQAVLELDPTNDLCQNISWIFCRADLLKQYVPFFQNLTNKMKADINMLRPRVMYLILCQVDCTLTVTVDGNLLLNNTQICYQSL